MKRPIGIFNDIYPGLPAEQASQIKKAGFDCVQVRPPRYETKDLTEKSCRDHVAPFLDAGFKIAAVAGYTNLVSVKDRKSQLARFYRLIELTPYFDTRYIATETGTKNPKSEWEGHPDNRKARTWAEMIGVLKEAIVIAEANDVVLLVEGYVENICATIDDSRRLRQELPTKHLQFVLDPNNYYLEKDLKDGDAHLRSIFEAIGDAAPIAHAKDVLYVEGKVTTPRAGTGKLNWPLFAKLLNQYQPDAPLIIEHLTRDEVGETKAFVEKHLAN